MSVKRKSTRTSGIGGVLIAALLTFILGTVLALVSLTTQEVRRVSELPEPERREVGVVYWVRGDAGIGNQSWQAKRRHFLNGSVQDLDLSEADLNRWSRSLLAPANASTAQLDADADSDKPPRKPMINISFAEPDFRISDSILHAGTTIQIPLFGKTYQVVYQIQGHFEARDEEVVFVHDGSSLGRSPVGHIPVLGTSLAKWAIRAYGDRPESNELRSRWDCVEKAALIEDRLELVLKPTDPATSGEG